MNKVINVMRQRRSIRRYTTKPVGENDLNTIVQAGSWAPFASKESRHFTIVQNTQVLKELNEDAKKAAQLVGSDLLKELGRQDGFHSFYKAPVLIIVSGKETAAQPEADCAVAAGSMLLAAEALGLGSCWIHFVLMAFMTDEGKKAWLDKLQIPVAYRPMAAVALGYKEEKQPEHDGKANGTFNFIK